MMLLRVLRTWGGVCLAILFLQQMTVCGSEADLKIPDLRTVSFNAQGANITGLALMYGGLVICLLGVAFGLLQYKQTKALDVHASMSAVSQVIWETCKTYLWQQGKFLAVLWVLIAACIAYYFYFLQHVPLGNTILILLASILGILGS